MLLGAQGFSNYSLGALDFVSNNKGPNRDNFIATTKGIFNAAIHPVDTLTDGLINVGNIPKRLWNAKTPYEIADARSDALIFIGSTWPAGKALKPAGKTVKNAPHLYYVDSIKHISDGEVIILKSGDLFASGGHNLKSTTVHLEKRLNMPDVNGVYEGLISIKDPISGKFVRKGSKTTFFPETWTKEMIDVEVNWAFKNSVPDPDNPKKWSGKSLSGVKIQGTRDKKGLTSAYPVYQGPAK